MTQSLDGVANLLPNNYCAFHIALLHHGVTRSSVTDVRAVVVAMHCLTTLIIYNSASLVDEN